MKSLRLALRQPTSLYKGGESLRLALARPTSLYKGGESLRLAASPPHNPFGVTAWNLNKNECA